MHLDDPSPGQQPSLGRIAFGGRSCFVGLVFTCSFGRGCPEIHYLGISLTLWGSVGRMALYLSLVVAFFAILIVERGREPPHQGPRLAKLKWDPFIIVTYLRVCRKDWLQPLRFVYPVFSFDLFLSLLSSETHLGQNAATTEALGLS